MGALEDRYFMMEEGEVSLLPPIDVRPGTAALMIIDMQYHDAHPEHGVVAALEKLYPGSTGYYAERLELVVPQIAKLLEYARDTGLNVIHQIVGSEFRDLRDFNRRMRSWIFDLQERSGMEDFYWSGSPTFRILDELAPVDDETVLVKKSYGAFNSTNIENVLREMGVDTLIIVGCVTNYCVETTARDAADRGFAVVLVDEANAAFSQEAHDATLASMRGGFAAVVPTAEAMIELLELKQEVAEARD